MQPAEEQYDVGVIVGRFQVHELHAAHRELIEHVRERHEKIIVFLGLSPLTVSSNNPLDFEARKKMLLAEYPDLIVLYAKDVYDDAVWSENLDSMIVDVTTPGQTVVLYGGRDSFISHYTGVFETRELTQSTFMSGTAQRKQIARSQARGSADFRAGVIWASQARYPTAFTTVDIAILNDEGQLLLGRKPGERLYRFVGGFSDPKSDSFEVDAIREVREETSLEVGDLKYIGSTRVDDWRYRNEPDGIKTMMFTARYLHGRPTPGDDIEEVRWFGLGAVMAGKNFDLEHVMPTHRPLMEMLRKELNNDR